MIFGNIKKCRIFAHKDSVMVGKFIVFEGVGGAGKTSLIEYLCKLLSMDGLYVTCTKEPYDVSFKSTSLYKANAPLAYTLDRKLHDSVIKEYMASSDVVLCDRYLLSSIIYQGKDISEEVVAELNSGCLAPDLTIVLRVDAGTAISRIKSSGIVGVPDDKIIKELVKSYSVNELERLANKFPVLGKIEVVDATRKFSQVFMSVMQAISLHFKVD